jgi:hypothetical protein
MVVVVLFDRSNHTRQAGLAASQAQQKAIVGNLEDLEDSRGVTWLEGTNRGFNRFSLGLLFVCHAVL